MNQKDALRTIVENIGFEVMPFKGIEEKVVTKVDKSVPLTVTTTEAKGIDRTLEVAIHLRQRGFAVAPHLGARLFVDQAHVQSVADRLKADDIDRIFVIGGDAPEPHGEFFDALSLLKAIEATGHTFANVGIGGYPEGHPSFSAHVARQALVDKSKYADRVITQMCFDTKIVTDWATDMTTSGAAIDYHIGMPGPVNRQKLIRISAQIGLGQSARFLQKQNGLWRFFLPGAYNPTKLVKKLAAAQQGGHTRINGVHLFTFNEIDGAVEWRRKMRRDAGLDR